MVEITIRIDDAGQVVSFASRNVTEKVTEEQPPGEKNARPLVTQRAGRSAGSVTPPAKTSVPTEQEHVEIVHEIQANAEGLVHQLRELGVNRGKQLVFRNGVSRCQEVVSWALDQDRKGLLNRPVGAVIGAVLSKRGG